MRIDGAQADVGYGIARPYWGQGYTTETPQAIIDMLPVAACQTNTPERLLPIMPAILVLDQQVRDLPCRDGNPRAVELHCEVNRLKGTEALPWGYAVSKCAFQESLRNLQTAIDNLRAGRQGQRKGAPMRFPKHRSRKQGLGHLPLHRRDQGLRGVHPAAAHRGRAAEGARRSAHRQAHQEGDDPWACRARVDVPVDAKAPAPACGEVLGVDVGIKTLAAC